MSLSGVLEQTMREPEQVVGATKLAEGRKHTTNVSAHMNYGSKSWCVGPDPPSSFVARWLSGEFPPPLEQK